jgi:predicted nucleic acid-binding protein
MEITAVVDTNIFLNVKNREESFYQYSKKVLDSVNEGRLKALVSVVSIVELCAGYYAVGDERGKRELLTHLMSSEGFSVINLDVKLADAAGKIRAETGLRLPDSIIVASGLARGAKYIVTHDEEFRKADGYVEYITSEEMVEILLSIEKIDS